MPLIDTLAAELAALHVDQLAGLHAQAGRIDAAEQLAQRLQRGGVNAQAEGKIRDNGTVSIWIRATAEAPRILNILKALDIPDVRPSDRITSWEIRVAGDLPIYVFQPFVSEQASA